MDDALFMGIAKCEEMWGRGKGVMGSGGSVLDFALPRRDRDDCFTEWLSEPCRLVVDGEEVVMRRMGCKKQFPFFLFAVVVSVFP